MNQLETIAKQLRSLRLGAAASQLATLVATAEANEASYLSFAESLVSHEITQRNVNRIKRHYKQAQFPNEKRLDLFDYRHQTTVTKRQINGLLDFSFIDERQNVIFIGPPGVGKTHLAIGIGHEAIQAALQGIIQKRIDVS